MTPVALNGKDFKDAVSAVCKLPAMGSFADAERLVLSCRDNMLTVMTSSLVLAVCRVLVAEGELDTISVERRVVEAFAGYCSAAARVTLRVNGNELVVKSRSHEVANAIAPAKLVKVPSIKDVPELKITQVSAKRIAYLADVAFSDSSRPELNCVMIDSNQAIAVNQKTIAALAVAKASNLTATPIPLELAKLVGEGDVLYIGLRETVLKAGSVRYSMPSVVKAQKDFPLASVKKYGELETEELGVLPGGKLAAVAQECGAILGQAARTEIVLELACNDKGKLVVAGNNGGARFRALLPIQGVFQGVLKVPLEALLLVTPFVGESATLRRGKSGELILGVDDGWVLFPSWQEATKKKKGK